MSCDGVHGGRPRASAESTSGGFPAGFELLVGILHWVRRAQAGSIALRKVRIQARLQHLLMRARLGATTMAGGMMPFRMISITLMCLSSLTSGPISRCTYAASKTGPHTSERRGVGAGIDANHDDRNCRLL